MELGLKARQRRHDAVMMMRAREANIFCEDYGHHRRPRPERKPQ